jgi:predicted nucleic acid binding AN1-type Zn finger protein
MNNLDEFLLKMLSETNYNTESSSSSEAKEEIKRVKREMPKKCECSGCNKKLLLSSLQCKCEKYFCDMHRYSDNHKCTFDYKLNNENKLKKELVEVKSDKVDKI